MCTGNNVLQINTNKKKINIGGKEQHLLQVDGSVTDIDSSDIESNVSSNESEVLYDTDNKIDKIKLL